MAKAETRVIEEDRLEWREISAEREARWADIEVEEAV